ncbi:hypothetical protein SUGI_1108760 [Cryptomeria japonica]|uniref:probable trehalose-phosphate phosphatase H n=1 Tax=Cryptomeria japonica TaxID=3369 RepID=UPI002414765A|nr:probable trehalose-phosphate phosphatase H [Cryptomeria japonica]XP_057840761.1 probable trehalose-phosphate phosphatase H [Cryptomeria japonica]XP_057840767.1 probable trehalose-phosphate phosphatase H [Cryptomeria japonica]XP_057840773.1 probable trehalose-phosphate phosphatase H [Cryptomeria japonica]GLJ52124.1 hypothetical protein SUGI_1108760 [Cryptomeria japonica]
MAFGSECNPVLTDPPVAVSNSSIFSCSSSSPYTPSSASVVSLSPIDFQQHMNEFFRVPQIIKDTHAYSEWTVHHPSALDRFREIMSKSEGKQIVVFLDYDGTLSPIVDNPDKAYMTSQMRDAVKTVAKRFPTAIISGRCLEKVVKFVKLEELYYAGSHGMDIKGPEPPSSKGSKANGKATYRTGNNGILYQPASEFLPMMDKIFASLVEKTKRIIGAIVENNKFCVSVHYRNVEQKNWAALKEQIFSVLKEYQHHGIRLTEGKMVIEIRPPIKWDKGKALEFLLQSLGLANCNDVLPLYIGDDRTDEDAFKVLRDRGQGFGILVSESPKETSANYSLRKPTEVMKFLQRLGQWKQHNMPKGGRLSKV